MIKYLSFKFLDNSYCATFNEPTICPMCAHAIEPILVSHKCHEIVDKKAYFSAFFECTFCKRAFVTTYLLTHTPDSHTSMHYSQEDLLITAPHIPTSRTFEKVLTDLSPQFAKIYNQALVAEVYKLDEIAGIGYRKSLEFIIKDYCKYLHEGDSENIEKMPLSQCIDKYIDNSKLKSTAKLSAWIGNDETHYIRIHNDKDINYLKKYIDTVVLFILFNLHADEANNIVNSHD